MSPHLSCMAVDTTGLVDKIGSVFELVEGGTSATGAAIGSGALRIRYFTGKMISVAGSWSWTAGRDRR